jgi:hypothetical protein
MFSPITLILMALATQELIFTKIKINMTVKAKETHPHHV